MQGEELIACGVVSPYPISLDHRGDNAAVFADAPAIIILTSTDPNTGLYQYMGELAQTWMLNAIEHQMGLCVMGLPIFPEALCQAMVGDIHMAYVLGHVSAVQLSDKKV